jgi:2-oxoisovalerate dehydrogenase E2 component (dihydrolipoyl transacylase)
VSERREFRLPDLGEGLTEAEIVSWQVAVGDTVQLNQVIAEVETEKAVVELPSPFAGTVLELLAETGATVDVGAPIIAIGVDAGVAVVEAAAEAVAEAADEGAPWVDDDAVPTLVGYGPAEAPASRRHRRRSGAARQTVAPGVRPLAKPPVRYMARVMGVDLAEVEGTGPDGVITREDVTRSAEQQSPGKGSKSADAERETRSPVRGVRKHTAEAMVRSAFTAPHVTEFLTVDVTPTMELVEKLRASDVFEGVHLTFLTLIARAVVSGLDANPSLNSTWDEEHLEIVTKHYVNLGIAVATPRGLVVPNIKDAHTMKMRDLAASLAQLTATAREGRSTPSDLSGGTFTITNIGVFGVDGGTPIINPGEAAILCVGAVRRQPWEFEGAIALRQLVTLSLSFDHRLVDGQEGSVFLASVGRMLADPGYLLALS